MGHRLAARLLLLLALALAAATSRDALSQTDCPDGNVLERARLSTAYDAYHTERLNDGLVGPDGEHWLSDRNALFTEVGYVVYELPRPTRITSLVLQADANDGYRVSGSLDGERWQPLGEVPATEGVGMRTRWATGFDRELRFLRFEPGRGDGQFSVGEIAAYCRVPDPWPPRFDVRPGVVRDELWARERERRLALGKIAFGLIGGLIVVWAARSRKRDGPPRGWLAHGLLGAVIVGGAFSWVNFGTFHGLNVWHHHELFHYVLGSKYFDENRYTRLYHCTETAEAEMGRRNFVERRVIRNLASNELEPATEVLADPGPCRAAFSAARWDEFKRDVEFYRSRDYPGSWGEIFRDHGYNATPVWTLFGRAIVGLDSVSRHPALLVAIDFVLYAGLFASILWAFGSDVAAIAALIWGVGLPWQYSWTGGAFGRVPWLFLAVAAVCLLRRSRFGLGGAALAGSALLRIFPALLALGPALWAVRDLVRTRRLAGPPLRMLAGALLVLAVLLPVAAWSTGGFGVWGDFFSNLRKHADSPLGNDVGLPVLFSWDASNVQADVLTGRLADFGDWERSRRETFASRRPLYLASALSVFVVFAWFVLGYARAEWETMCAGTLPILAFSEVASYYLVFFILLSPFGAGRPARTALLVGSVVLSQAARFPRFSVDTLFLVQSVLFLVATLALVVGLIRERRRGEGGPG